jgi:photosystem II stability/assembly factor-like uncharacterized protein
MRPWPLAAALVLGGCFDFSSLKPTGTGDASVADMIALGDAGAPLKWSTQTSGTDQALRAVGGRGADVWVVGDAGTILHSSDRGAHWSAQQGCTTSTLRAVGTVGAVVYVGGDASALCRSTDAGRSWLAVMPFAVPLETIHAIVGLAPTVVLGEDGGNIVTFTDGKPDFTAPVGPAAGWTYNGLWAGTGEIWAVGSAPGDADAGSPIHGIYRRYSAGAWGPHYTNAIGALTSVWSDGAGAVWFGTDASNAVFSHDDGVSWRKYINPWPANEPYLWGAADDDIWAVGDSLTMLHHDLNGWSPVPNPSHKTLHAVWGTASDDVYCVGEGGAILHYP